MTESSENPWVEACVPLKKLCFAQTLNPTLLSQQESGHVQNVGECYGLISDQGPDVNRDFTKSRSQVIRGY